MWSLGQDTVVDGAEGHTQLEREREKDRVKRTEGKTEAKRKRERLILNDTFKEVIRQEPQSF